jgi:DNA primase
MNSEKINICINTLGQYYASKDEILFKCPFCNHYKKKLSINLEKAVFKCWICNSRGGLNYLINRFASKSDKYQWLLLTQEIDMSIANEIFAVEEKVKKQTINLPIEYTWLGHKNLLYESKAPLKYLVSRGLTEKDIILYKIGFCSFGEYRNRIIIPSFDEDGDCSFFAARSYKDDWLKYKNPPVKKNIIFNDLLIDWTRPVTLVEGIFDSIKTENSIPILGSTLSVRSILFEKIVAKQTKIYIGFDQDALFKSLKVIRSMIEYGIEVSKIDTSNIEDLGSITKQETKVLQNQSTLMTFENLLKLQWR